MLLLGRKAKSISYAPYSARIRDFCMIHPHNLHVSKIFPRPLITRSIRRRKNTVITRSDKVNTLLLADIFKLNYTTLKH